MSRVTTKKKPTSNVITFPKRRNGNVETIRDKIAKELRKLSVEFAKNTFALGVKLKEARDTFPAEGMGKSRRPGWWEWVRINVGFDQKHVNKLIQVADKFSEKQADETLYERFTVTVLTILASDSIPPAAEKEIMKKAKAGERVTAKKAKEIVTKHRARNGTLPSPKQANALAKKHNAVIPGSDGRYHGGFTKEEEAEDQRLVNLIIGFWDLVKEMAARSDLAPKEFFRLADENSLWVFYREHDGNFRKAHRWFNGMFEEWRKRPRSKRFSKGRKRRGPPVEFLPLSDIWPEKKAARGRAR
jgi:hypothetical protein